MTTNYVVLVFLVVTWNKINTFQTSQWCLLKLAVSKFQKYQGWQMIIQTNVCLEVPFSTFPFLYDARFYWNRFSNKL